MTSESQEFAEKVTPLISEEEQKVRKKGWRGHDRTVAVDDLVQAQEEAGLIEAEKLSRQSRARRADIALALAATPASPTR